METVIVKTKPCMNCGDTDVLEVGKKAYESWASGQLATQDAFPEMDSSEREMLITGTHPRCWDEMFPMEDEDED